MEIQICNTCEGSGKIVVDNYFGDCDFATCGSCNGTGRVYTRKFTITIPYEQQIPHEYNELDSEIMHKIRTFMEKHNANTRSK